jgi:hypothetical protein
MAKHARSGPVSVADKGVRVRRLRRDEGVAEAHRRFGGLDIPASLAGTLCALGLTVLLARLLTGIGSIGYQTAVWFIVLAAVPGLPDAPPAQAGLHELGPSR